MLFKYTAKLRRNHENFPYTSIATPQCTNIHTSPLSHSYTRMVNLIQQANPHPLIIHYLPGCVVSIRLHSGCCTFSRSWQIYNLTGIYHERIIQIRLLTLNICAYALQDFLSLTFKKNDLFTFSLVVPCLKCHLIGTIQYVGCSYCPLFVQLYALMFPPCFLMDW